jgi:anti-sigma factor RsiW
MGCDREKILLYVEGELAPEDAARLLAHVAQCDPCRAALDDERELARALGGLDDLECPEDFASDTMTRARCDLTQAVSNPRERTRAVLIAAGLSGVAVFLLWPIGLLDPVVRALGPLPCISRCVLAGCAKPAVGAFMVGRAVSRHVFERHDASTVALALLAVLLVLLGLLLRRYHARGAAEGGGVRR